MVSAISHKPFLLVMALSSWSIAMAILLSVRGAVFEPGNIFLSDPRPLPVALHLSGTTHYGLHHTAEWDALVPSNNHTIRLNGQTFTPRIFHQMKCLNIIRAHYLGRQAVSPPPIIRHCLLYLRQMIYCQSNSRLESAHNTRGSADREYEAVCEDWEAVYRSIDANHILT
ncbi:hypothetical protein DL96DRAFT_1506023 [Flagelloscypha sp. PMI_526]|nr:hypothetical protein DL96DRAFT_1506023 [Flagelloscypha sp. PMI_526]